MRRHRWDDVARLWTCSVVAIDCLRSSVELLTWHVVVVGGGGGGDEAELGEDGGRETKSIVCLRRAYEFPANAAHALS